MVAVCQPYNKRILYYLLWNITSRLRTSEEGKTVTPVSVTLYYCYWLGMRYGKCANLF